MAREDSADACSPWGSVGGVRDPPPGRVLRGAGRALERGVLPPHGRPPKARHVVILTVGGRDRARQPHIGSRSRTGVAVFLPTGAGGRTGDSRVTAWESMDALIVRFDFAVVPMRRRSHAERSPGLRAARAQLGVPRGAACTTLGRGAARAPLGRHPRTAPCATCAGRDPSRLAADSGVSCCGRIGWCGGQWPLGVGAHEPMGRHFGFAFAPQSRRGGGHVAPQRRRK